MACNSKMAGRRAKLRDICDTGTLLTHIQGTCDLVVLKVIWGNSVCLSQNGLYPDRSTKLSEI